MDLNILDSGLRRILLMTYFPSGFWSRLITRLLADDQITESIKNVYAMVNDVQQDFSFDLRSSLESDTNWNLWQTGLALYYGPTLIFKIWELPFQMAANTQPFRNSANRFKLRLDGIWTDINLCNSSILEIHFPLLKVNVYQEAEEENKQLITQIEPNMPVVAKLLALSVDHIDLLLEDWYPSLGTRFVHTSEGRFLITRLVMCPKCLRKLGKKSDADNGNGNGDGDVADASSLGYVNRSRSKRPVYLHGDMCEDGLNVFSAYLNATVRRERRSEVSFVSGVFEQVILTVTSK